MTRARKNSIVINVDWNNIANKPDEIGAVTFETLNGNGDIGTGADQVAVGDHDHEIGDMIVLLNNAMA